MANSIIKTENLKRKKVAKYTSKTKRYRVIEVHYYGATNHRGARIKLKDTYSDNDVKWLNISSAPFNRGIETAFEYLIEKGFTICGDAYCASAPIDYIMVDNFNMSIL